MTTKFFHKKSVSGAILLFLIVLQCVTGIMLAIGYSQECMLTPYSRNVEDMGDLYTEDFFWAHERLVDLIFITMYFHMYKKLSVSTFVKEQTKA